jgi:excisionase family DNA binding protein
MTIGDVQVGVREERILLPINDAAPLIGIGRTKLFELLASGEIESVTIGKRRLIPRQSLTDFVNRLRLQAVS